MLIKSNTSYKSSICFHHMDVTFSICFVIPPEIPKDHSVSIFHDLAEEEAFYHQCMFNTHWHGSVTKYACIDSITPSLIQRASGTQSGYAHAFQYLV